MKKNIATKPMLNEVGGAVEKEEWGKWECPTCKDDCEDPDSIYETTCSKGHHVRLGAIENGYRDAWAVTANFI